mmetsp:Transcript_26853/g.90524  ORF Transcript_26853/g.90524 Transcript_26853/m.90524 type:complete len:414 (+) Transcript_26853:645-1886(+)
MAQELERNLVRQLLERKQRRTKVVGDVALSGGEQDGSRPLREAPEGLGLRLAPHIVEDDQAVALVERLLDQLTNSVGVAARALKLVVRYSRSLCKLEQQCDGLPLLAKGQPEDAVAESRLHPHVVREPGRRRALAEAGRPSDAHCDCGSVARREAFADDDEHASATGPAAQQLVAQVQLLRPLDVVRGQARHVVQLLGGQRREQHRQPRRDGLARAPLPRRHRVGERPRLDRLAAGAANARGDLDRALAVLERLAHVSPAELLAQPRCEAAKEANREELRRNVGRAGGPANGRYAKAGADGLAELLRRAAVEHDQLDLPARCAEHVGQRGGRDELERARRVGQPERRVASKRKPRVAVADEAHDARLAAHHQRIERGGAAVALGERRAVPCAAVDAKELADGIRLERRLRQRR